jgi:hypothetical protein
MEGMQKPYGSGCRTTYAHSNGDELAQKLTTRREHAETMPPFLGTCLALSNGRADLDHAMFS